MSVFCTVEKLGESFNQIATVAEGFEDVRLYNNHENKKIHGSLKTLTNPDVFLTEDEYIVVLENFVKNLDYVKDKKTIVIDDTTSADFILDVTKYLSFVDKNYKFKNTSEKRIWEIIKANILKHQQDISVYGGFIFISKTDIYDSIAKQYSLLYNIPIEKATEEVVTFVVNNIPTNGNKILKHIDKIKTLKAIRDKGYAPKITGEDYKKHSLYARYKKIKDSVKKRKYKLVNPLSGLSTQIPIISLSIVLDSIVSRYIATNRDASLSGVLYQEYQNFRNIINQAVADPYSDKAITNLQSAARRIIGALYLQEGGKTSFADIFMQYLDRELITQEGMLRYLIDLYDRNLTEAVDEENLFSLLTNLENFIIYFGDNKYGFYSFISALFENLGKLNFVSVADEKQTTDDNNAEEREEGSIDEITEDSTDNLDTYDFTAEDLFKEIPPLASILGGFTSTGSDSVKSYMSYINQIILSGKNFTEFSEEMNNVLYKDIQNGKITTDTIENNDFIYMHILFGITDTTKPISTYSKETLLLFKDIDRKVVSYIPCNNFIKMNNRIANNHRSRHLVYDSLELIRNIFINSDKIYSIYYQISSGKKFNNEEKEQLAEDIATLLRDLFADMDVQIKRVNKYTIYFILDSQRGFIENVLKNIISHITNSTNNYLNMQIESVGSEVIYERHKKMMNEFKKSFGFITPYVITAWIEDRMLKTPYNFNVFGGDNGLNQKMIPYFNTYLKKNKQTVLYYYKASLTNLSKNLIVSMRIYNAAKLQSKNISLDDFLTNKQSIIYSNIETIEIYSELYRHAFNHLMNKLSIDYALPVNEATAKEHSQLFSNIEDLLAAVPPYLFSDFVNAIFYNAGITNPSLINKCLKYERRKNLDKVEKPAKYDTVLEQLLRHLKNITKGDKIYESILSQIDFSNLSFNKVLAFINVMAYMEMEKGYNVLSPYSAQPTHVSKLSSDMYNYVVFSSRSLLATEISRYTVFYLYRAEQEYFSENWVSIQTVKTDNIQRYDYSLDESPYKMQIGNLAYAGRRVKQSLITVSNYQGAEAINIQEAVSLFIEFLEEMGESVVRNTMGSAGGSSTRSLKYTLTNQVTLYVDEVNRSINNEPVGKNSLVENMVVTPVMVQNAKASNLRLSYSLFRGYDSVKFSKLTPRAREQAAVVFLTYSGEAVAGTSQDKSTVPTISYSYGNKNTFTIAKTITSGNLTISDPSHIGIPGYYMLAGTMRASNITEVEGIHAIIKRSAKKGQGVEKLDEKTINELNAFVLNHNTVSKNYVNTYERWRYNILFASIHDRLYEILQTDISYYLYFKTIEGITNKRNELIVERLWGNNFGDVNFSAKGNYLWRYLITELDFINTNLVESGKEPIDISTFIQNISGIIDNMSLAFYDKVKKEQKKIFNNANLSIEEKNNIFSEYLRKELREHVGKVVNAFFDFKSTNNKNIQADIAAYEVTSKKTWEVYNELHTSEENGNLDAYIDGMTVGGVKPHKSQLRTNPFTMGLGDIQKFHNIYYLKSAAVNSINVQNVFDDIPTLTGYLGFLMFLNNFYEGARIFKNMVLKAGGDVAALNKTITRIILNVDKKLSNKTTLQYIVQSGHMFSSSSSLVTNAAHERAFFVTLDENEISALKINKVLSGLNVLNNEQIANGYGYTIVENIFATLGSNRYERQTDEKEDDEPIDEYDDEYAASKNKDNAETEKQNNDIKKAKKAARLFTADNLYYALSQYAALANTTVTLTEFTRGYLYNNDIGEKANKRIVATTSPGVTFEMTPFKKQMLLYYFDEEFKTNPALREYLKPIIENEVIHVSNYEDTRVDINSEESASRILISTVKNTFKNIEGYSKLEGQNGFTIIPLEVYKAIRILQEKWTEQDEIIYRRIINNIHDENDLVYVVNNFRPIHADKNQYSGFQTGRPVLVNTNLKHMAFPFHENMIPDFKNRELVIDVLNEMRVKIVHFLTAISGTKTNKLTIAKLSNPSDRSKFSINKETGLLENNTGYIYIREKLPLRYFKENTPKRNETKDEVYINIKLLFYGFIFTDHMISVGLGDNMVVNMLKESYAVSYGVPVSSVNIESEEFKQYYETLTKTMIELKNTFFASFIDNMAKKAKQIEEETGVNILEASDATIIEYVKSNLKNDGYSSEQIAKLFTMLGSDILLNIGPVKRIVNGLVKTIDNIRKVRGDKHTLVPDFFNTHYHPGDQIEEVYFHTNHHTGINIIKGIVTTKNITKDEYYRMKEITYEVSPTGKMTLYEFLKKNYNSQSKQKSIAWIADYLGYNSHYVRNMVENMEKEKDNLSSYYVYPAKPNNALINQNYIDANDNIVTSIDMLGKKIKEITTNNTYNMFYLTIGDKTVGVLVGKMDNQYFYHITNYHSIKTEIEFLNTIKKVIFDILPQVVEIKAITDPNDVRMFELFGVLYGGEEYSGLLVNKNTNTVVKIISRTDTQKDMLVNMGDVLYKLLKYYKEKDEAVFDFILKELKYEGDKEEVFKNLVTAINSLAVEYRREGKTSLLPYGFNINIFDLTGTVGEYVITNINPLLSGIYLYLTDIGIKGISLDKVINQVIKSNTSNILLPVLSYAINNMQQEKMGKYKYYSYRLELGRKKGKETIYSIPEVLNKTKGVKTVVTRPVEQYNSVSFSSIPLFFLKLPGNVVLAKYGVRLINLVIKKDILGIIELVYPDKTSDAEFKKVLAAEVSRLNDVISDYLNTVGYRVPTQNISSLVNGRVVGFFHPGVGAAATTNTFITGSQGSDYDDDSNTNLYVVPALNIKIKGRAATKEEQETIEMLKTLNGVLGYLKDRDKGIKALVDFLSKPEVEVTIVDDYEEYQLNNMTRSLYRSLVLPFNQINKLIPVSDGPLIRTVKKVAEKRSKATIAATERSVTASSMVKNSLDRIGAVVFLQNVFANSNGKDTYGNDVNNPFMYEICGEKVTLTVDVPSDDSVKYIQTFFSVHTIAQTFSVFNFYYIANFKDYETFIKQTDKTGYQLIGDEEVVLNEETNEKIKLKELYQKTTDEAVDYLLRLEPYVSRMVDMLETNKNKSFGKLSNNQVVKNFMMDAHDDFVEKVNALSKNQKTYIKSKLNDFNLRSVDAYINFMLGDDFMRFMLEKTLERVIKTKYAEKIGLEKQIKDIKTSLSKIPQEKANKRMASFYEGILLDPIIQNEILKSLYEEAREKNNYAVLDFFGNLFAFMHYENGKEKSQETIDLADFKKMITLAKTNFDLITGRNPAVAKIVTGYYNTNVFLRFIVRPFLPTETETYAGRTLSASFFKLYVADMLLSGLINQSLFVPIGGRTITHATENMKHILYSKDKELLDILKVENVLTNNMVFNLDMGDLQKIKNPYYLIFAQLFTLLVKMSDLISALEKTDAGIHEDKKEKVVTELKGVFSEVIEILNSSISSTLETNNITNLSSRFMETFFDSRNYRSSMQVFSKILFAFYKFNNTLRDNIDMFAFSGNNQMGFNLFSNINISADPTSAVLAYGDSKNEKKVNRLCVFLTNRSSYRTPEFYSDLLNDIMLLSKYTSDQGAISDFYNDLISFLANGFKVGIMNTVNKSIYSSQLKNIGYLLPLALPFLEYVKNTTLSFRSFKNLLDDSTETMITEEYIHDFTKNMYVRDKDLAEENKVLSGKNPDTRQELLALDAVFMLLALPTYAKIRTTDENMWKLLDLNNKMKALLLYNWEDVEMKKWMKGILDDKETETGKVGTDTEGNADKLEMPHMSIYYFDRMISELESDNRISQKYKKVFQNKRTIRHILYLVNVSKLSALKDAMRKSSLKTLLPVVIRNYAYMLHLKSGNWSKNITEKEEVKEFLDIMKEYMFMMGDNDVLSLMADKHNTILEQYYSEYPLSIRSQKRETSPVKDANSLKNNYLFNMNMGLSLPTDKTIIPDIKNIGLKPGDLDANILSESGTESNLKYIEKLEYYIDRLKKLSEGKTEKSEIELYEERTYYIDAINETINFVISVEQLDAAIEQSNVLFPLNIFDVKENPDSTQIGLDFKSGDKTLRIIYVKNIGIENPYVRNIYVSFFNNYFKIDVSDITVKDIENHITYILKSDEYSQAFKQYANTVRDMLNLSENSAYFEYIRAVYALMRKHKIKTLAVKAGARKLDTYDKLLFRHIAEISYDNNVNKAASVEFKNITSIVSRHRAINYLHGRDFYYNMYATRAREIDRFFEDTSYFSDSLIDIEQIFKQIIDKNNILELSKTLDEKGKIELGNKIIRDTMIAMVNFKRILSVKRATAIANTTVPLLVKVINSVEEILNVKLPAEDKNRALYTFANYMLKYFETYINVEKEKKELGIDFENADIQIIPEESNERIPIEEEDGTIVYVTREQMIEELKKMEEYKDEPLEDYETEMLTQLYKCK